MTSHTPDSTDRALHLFDAMGIELEYMIVDQGTLSVKPIADELLKAASGAYSSEIERDGGISWSNELCLHVLELKTTTPARHTHDLTHKFMRSVAEINALLKPLGARLMPGGMHPWMNPDTEMKLWPHEYSEVYQNFDRIFGCKGHGWANLQAVHLNLPFQGDVEFGKLHAAIRMLLPLLPALTAASPIMDGRMSGAMDNRLEVYKNNSKRFASITGSVIPEPVYTRAAYERDILQPIYSDVRPHDPNGEMQFEWMNARGAIARFDRGAIEIRVMDVQECPAADVAICAAVRKVLHWLVNEGPCDTGVQMETDTALLRAVFDRVSVDADQAVINDEEYLELMTMDSEGPKYAWEVWTELMDLAEVPMTDPLFAPIQTILDQGPLARRISTVLGVEKGPIKPEAMREIAGELCDCLSQGRMLDAS